METQIIKAVLMEVRDICKAGTCETCDFAGEGSRRCVFGTAPADWEFPIFTPSERELLRLTGAKFVSRDACGVNRDNVRLWRARPVRLNGSGGDRDGGGYLAVGSQSDALCGCLPAELFPGISPGVCWDVAVLLGEDGKEDQ